MPRVVLAPDKFRGTATAARASAAMAEAATSLGWEVTALAMSDGGEGFLDAAATRCPEVVSTTVTGPGGRPVDAVWRCGDGVAVIEMARASGLEIAAREGPLDAVGATSRGTGELIMAAARRVGPDGTVVVGLGGSATTDGGSGAVEAVDELGGIDGVALVVACDTTVTFVDAARVYAPQKGARADQVALLTDRLRRQVTTYRDRYGVDVSEVPGAGAAGGLGGGLLVLGGTLVPGYQVVCDLVGMDAALTGADRVVTGEGALDGTSFLGKLVGGVVADARGRGIPTLVVAGQSTAGGEERARAAGCDVVSLTGEFGPKRARSDTAACIGEVTRVWLGAARP